MKEQSRRFLTRNQGVPEKDGEADKKLQNFGFFGLLFFFLVLAVLLLWPFYKLIFLAGILTVLFLPMYKFLLRKIRSEYFSAILTVLAILVIVITPLYFISQIAIKEISAFYNQYSQSGFELGSQALISNLPDAWHGTAENLTITISESISAWAHSLILDFAGIISNIAGFLLSFFLLFLIVFFLLKDHVKLIKFINELFPLPRKKVDILIQKLEFSINGVLRGDFLIALLQGVVAAIGFVVTGVPQPILWTIATILSSFVPTIGTSLIIIPAIFYLLFFKSLAAALILAIWYVVAHISVDNIIAPEIIGRQTQMHPLLVLLSIFGGLEVFGVMGFLFGPIIMAIFIAILEAYRTGNVKS